MLLQSTLLCCFLPAFLQLGAALSWTQKDRLRVQVRNGTYQGRFLKEYQQDVFLGVAFAQPPVGDLRFRNPEPLNSTWTGVRSAAEYAGDCPAYPQDFKTNYSEDCLYLNLWRPARHVAHASSLPVLVWIHGGGFSMGATSNPRFNMSWIVENSVKMGQPIMGISINYRLSVFGFLSSSEVRDSQSSNFGIRDQRLALHWIRENVAAFGGDPDRVTIFGESAGAASVGLQLTAYNGRDDNLFRHAIMQSGNPIFYGRSNDTATHQQRYNDLANASGCYSHTDTLDCLRRVPYTSLDALLKEKPQLAAGWIPQIDGDLIARHTLEQISDGHFVHVPVIIGANSDEGTAFGARGINNSEQFLANLVQNRVPVTVAEKLVSIYAQDSADQVLENLPPETVFPDAFGLQFRRVSTYAGDQIFIAHRRASCEAWARSGTRAFCYRFNAVPMNHGDRRAWMGATHFVEVAFVFLNLEGHGYDDYDPPQPVFDGLSESYKDLARLISGDWVAFTNHGDPNRWAGREDMAATLKVAVPAWPRYQVAKNNKHGPPPRVYVYEGNVTSHVERDNYRKAGMDLITSIDLAVYDR
ncbi:hypothetical protein ACJ41O_011671 [Fusarium nematophilum]